MAKSFRPISLSSFLLKTLERLIDSHIGRGCLKTFLLNRHQYAYQASKSCVLVIHELVRKTEKALGDKEIALEAFMDIEGAFNNISFLSIKTAAEEYGVNTTNCSELMSCSATEQYRLGWGTPLLKQW